MDKNGLCIIELLGKTNAWKVWYCKQLVRASKRGYKYIVVGTQKMSTKREYKTAVQKDPQDASGKSQIKNYELNQTSLEDLILSISGTPSTGNAAFKLVAGCKT